MIFGETLAGLQLMEKCLSWFRARLGIRICGMAHYPTNWGKDPSDSRRSERITTSCTA